MKLWTVFKFELGTYFKRKSFTVLTVILVLAAAVALSWPRISEAFSGRSESGEVIGEDGEVISSETEGADKILLIDETGEMAGAAEYFNAFFQGAYTFEESGLSVEQARSLVESGEVEGTVVLHSMLFYTRIVTSVSMYDYFDSSFGEALLSLYRIDAMSGLGVSEQDVQQVLGATVDSETETVGLGKNQMSRFFFTYALIFILYFAVVMYGQFVATSVATEKSTRAMELLITSAKPSSLMFGKVLGAGTAGIIQMVLLIVSAFVSYDFNSAYYGEDSLVSTIFVADSSLFLYAIIFFILGFFLYAFMYAAMASLVSRQEELSTMTMPVMLVFIASFFISMFSMTSGSVESTLMKVCSYIPLTSPMAMFARISMGEASMLQAWISIAILAASTVLFGMLATAIYKLGVLLYGNAPSPKLILKAFKK